MDELQKELYSWVIECPLNIRKVEELTYTDEIVLTLSTKQITGAINYDQPHNEER